MKIIHQNGYTPDELLMFRPTIYRNLLESAEAVVLAMRKLDIQPALQENRDTDVIARIERWCSRMRQEGWWGGERGARGALMWADGELEQEAKRAAQANNSVTLGNFFQAEVGNGGDIDGLFDPPSRNRSRIALEADEKISKQNRNDDFLPFEIAQAIHDLYSDPMFKYLVEERSGEFYLMDSGG